MRGLLALRRLSFARRVGARTERPRLEPSNGHEETLELAWCTWPCGWYSKRALLDVSGLLRKMVIGLRGALPAEVWLLIHVCWGCVGRERPTIIVSFVSREKLHHSDDFVELGFSFLRLRVPAVTVSARQGLCYDWDWVIAWSVSLVPSSSWDSLKT